jgi:hypothetical protein
MWSACWRWSAAGHAEGMSLAKRLRERLPGHALTPRQSVRAALPSYCLANYCSKLLRSIGTYGTERQRLKIADPNALSRLVAHLPS